MSWLSNAVDFVGGLFGGGSSSTNIGPTIDGIQHLELDSDGFDWLGLAEAALPTVADLGAGLFSSEAQKDADKVALEREEAKYQQELELARQKAALDLKLAALKAQYAGGGGGGGGGANTRLTDAQKLAAIQNQATLKQDAITSALNALQNAYGLGQR